MLAAGALAGLGPPLPTAVQATALLAGVAVIGAPHGVLDIDLALWAAPGRRRLRWLACVLAAYVGLIAVVLAAWTMAPAATLVVFLAASAGHFGAEDAGDDERSLLRTATRGLAVVLLPMLLHRAEVAPIFAALAGEPSRQVEAVLSTAAPALAVGWGSLAGATAVSLMRRRAVAGAAEFAALAALFAFAPPLLAFTVYFCGVHAPRHVAVTAARSGLPPAARLGWALRRLAPAALVTGAVLYALARADGAGAASTWTFRALAALTLPHLVLTPWLERRATSFGPCAPDSAGHAYAAAAAGRSAVRPLLSGGRERLR